VTLVKNRPDVHIMCESRVKMLFAFCGLPQNQTHVVQFLFVCEEHYAKFVSARNIFENSENEIYGLACMQTCFGKSKACVYANDLENLGVTLMPSQSRNWN
jgi:hypothetical protein